MSEGLSGGPGAVKRDESIIEDGETAKLACVPCMPTHEEVEAHNATHVPFRSWCAFCVAGKAKANPHFKGSNKVVQGENVVSLDYAFIGDRPPTADGDSDADSETETGGYRDSQGNLKVLVSRDRKRGYVCANVVPSKGDHPYVVHRVGHDLSNIMGYKRVILKSDQEPAIRKLKAAVRREYSLEIPEELSAVGDSQSNGEIEITIQVVEGQIRTLKCQLEHRIDKVIPADHALLPWLVRHAGACISRYQKGSDGLTGYRRLRGRNYDRVAIELGECVWYLLNKDQKRGKIEPRWDTGVYLGSREESNEILIGTPTGVIKARSFRRQGRHEDRWDPDRILGIKGLPWEPIPGIKTYDIRSRVAVPVDTPGNVLDVPEREFASRRFKITTSDINTHGATIGCPACSNILRHKRAGNHNETCRARIHRELTIRADPRIVREVSEALGEAIEPDALPPPDEAQQEEDRALERESAEEDGMSVAPSTNPDVEGMLYELTADYHRAHKLAKWESTVSSQWSGKCWSDGVREMDSLVQEGDIHSHVSEIYSPPRVTGLASGLGLVPGMALDLSAVDPDDGKAWDFNDPAKRSKALNMVFTQRSLLLIGSPMCSSFSRLQNLNWGRMSPEEVEKVKSYGRKHLRFACKLYALQKELCLYFLHEHPESASSWQEPCVKKLLDSPGVSRVVSDMCVYGMQQELQGVSHLVKKPTAFMTNSPEIARRLGQRCDGGHRHITLIGGRAKRAEIYPEQLCREILLGLIDQMKVDGRLLGNGCLGSVVQCDESTQEYQENMARYWDDVSGKELNGSQVREARKEEMKEFEKHKVYVKVPIAQCWARTGKKPIGVRWVDINKGDETKPKYRSRLVAMEFNSGKREDLFAATPPVEAKKLLMALATTEGYGYDRHGKWPSLKLDFIDVRRAFFHAPCRREVYVDLSEEDAEPGMCGLLQMAMYGTRDAPQNWEFEYTDFMTSCGFTQGKATPCLFFHEPRNIRVVVYGDDFTILGPEDQLDWFRKQMVKRYEVEFRARLSGESQDDKAVTLLNRPIEWTTGGITYEADQRHVEIIGRDLGLGSKVKHTPYPYEKPTAYEVNNPTPELDSKTATLYRAVVARANYLSQDRSDIRYAVKELCRSMSSPREGDLQRLKKLGRYLVSHPRLIQNFKRQCSTKFLDVWVDTDFAGCLSTRKSTSGGLITIGDHVIKSWSNTQSVIALSSGEAEYYGMVKGASMALGVRSMLGDLGVNLQIRLRTDASAAKGIATRRGLGKVRHIEVNQLWLQEKVNNGEIQVMKVKGEGNLADALTKALAGPGVKKHVVLTGQDMVLGRHILTPEFEAANENKEEVQDDEEGNNELEQDLYLFQSGSEVLELL